MNIDVIDLGIVSLDPGSRTKFILLQDGRLFFGKVKWYKDLAIAANLGEDAKVIGAGVVPNDVTEISDDAWGGWKSTGYGVVTEENLRETIRQALQAT